MPATRHQEFALSTTSPRRLRVLMSAYACGPGDAPEGNAGWLFARAAATHHEVVVFTRERFRPAIEAAFAAEPSLRGSLTVVHLELPAWVRRQQRRSWDVYWYYTLWQRKFAAAASAMHRRNPFDVGHHVTFASDWLPCGLRKVQVPMVWGPIGGASTPIPLRYLARWMGPRGTIGELIRESAVRFARRFFGNPVAARAAVVVAQNGDVARRFARSAEVVVEPNAAFDDAITTLLPPAPASRSGSRFGAPLPPLATEGRRAVFVGRLLALKGCRLVVATMAEPEMQGWQLDIYGTGPQEKALRGLAAELGVADRITFKGHQPRDRVLAAFKDADVMLFPSMHDQAGWVAGEASALGCPVVCLPLGGPATLAGPNARVVPIDRNLVHNLAVAASAPRAERVPYLRWNAARLAGLVDKWYQIAAESGG